MIKILIVGAGKIGSAIAYLLANADAYEVHLMDVDLSTPDVGRTLQAMPEIKAVQSDLSDRAFLHQYITQHHISALVSCLPHFLTAKLAVVARELQTHYFDLTEDVGVTEEIKQIAKKANTAFVPQCGLAPGIINIVTSNFIKEFNKNSASVKLRTGALPQNTSNFMHYALTWSTDGLINEYLNPCYGIENGTIKQFKSLDDVEKVILDGIVYEAFNTSGGSGNLANTFAGKIKNLNYKTLRYPGHVEKIKFLLEDLNLKHDKAMLKYLFESLIPRTYQDVVILYVSVDGLQHGQFIEKSYLRKFYPEIRGGIEWSAIQLATASGACAIVDFILMHKTAYKGYVAQDIFSLSDILSNRFGQYFR